MTDREQNEIKRRNTQAATAASSSTNDETLAIFLPGLRTGRSPIFSQPVLGVGERVNPPETHLSAPKRLS